MKVRSVTDIITNSSSEVFLVKTKLERKEIKTLDWLKTIQPGDGISGDGGGVDVWDGIVSDGYEVPYLMLLPEGYLVVEIDWSRSETINRFLKEFEVLDLEIGHYKFDPSTGRVTERILKDQWNALPKDQQRKPGAVMDKLFKETLQQRKDELEKKLAACKTDKEIAQIWPNYEKLQEAIEQYDD